MKHTEMRYVTIKSVIRYINFLYFITDGVARMKLQLLSARHQLEKLKKKDYKQGRVQINYILDFSSLGNTENVVIPIFCTPELAEKFLHYNINRNEVVINE